MPVTPIQAIADDAEVRLTRLGSGMTIATQAMPHLESVALGVWVGTGSRNEKASEHGISHLLEHMAFKGTKKRSARDIAEAIEAVGGEVNAATSVDNTAYYVRLLKNDTALGIDVLGDILTHSVFDQQELERERHVIVQEIGAALDTPEDRVFDNFQSAAYGDQPIGRTILGTVESIRSFNRETLQGYLRSHYCAPHMVLAAAGSVDHDEIVKLAETAFADIAKDSPPSTDKAQFAGGEILEEKALQEAQILIGFDAPALRDRDLYTGRILATILGDGMASRLFQEVREARGLCYSISAFHWPFEETGLIGIHAATGEEDLAELMPVIVTEIAKLADRIETSEIKRAKAQLRATLLMALESPVARAGQMARHMLIYGRSLPVAEIVEKIEAVTAADVTDLAGRIFAGPAALAAIGPIAPLPELGEITSQLAGKLGGNPGDHRGGRG
ncbi:MAG: insulinase family protein [Alphaproteobacteria bacterium]|nr:MAG: insulinase family protein [Alphaproteobacteria bacterium]